MTRKEALQALLAHIEAGEAQEWKTPSPFNRLAPNDATTQEIYDKWIDVICSAEKAYSGSLDAARALHEAVLPGWCWMKGYSVLGDGAHSVTVYLPAEDDADWRVAAGESDTPARAWLRAILKALIAEASE